LENIVERSEKIKIAIMIEEEEVLDSVVEVVIASVAEVVIVGVVEVVQALCQGASHLLVLEPIKALEEEVVVVVDLSQVLKENLFKDEFYY